MEGALHTSSIIGCASTSVTNSAFCTPIDKHECDLNIEVGEGANVIMCYIICDRDWLVSETNFCPGFVWKICDTEIESSKDQKERVMFPGQRSTLKKLF